MDLGRYVRLAQVWTIKPVLDSMTHGLVTQLLSLPGINSEKSSGAEDGLG